MPFHRNSFLFLMCQLLVLKEWKHNKLEPLDEF